MSSSSSVAAIYARISLDSIGDGAGVDRQLAACRDLARDRGFVVSQEYVDNSVSAFKDVPRPEFESMLNSGVGTVIVWHLDRLVRRIADLQRVIDAGIRVIPVRGAEVDPSEASGVLMSQVLTATAQFESQHKSERVKFAARSRATSGQLHPPIPYGYDAEGPTELGRQVVPALFREFLATKNIAAVQRLLTELDPDAARSRGAVRGLLTRHAYAGIASYRGQELSDVQTHWEPLISRDDFVRAQVILKSPTRRVSSHHRGLAQRLGTQLFRCGVCGETMIGAGTPNGAPSYRCRSNSHLNRSASDIDSLVFLWLLDRLENASVEQSLLPRSPSDADRTEADDLIAELTRLKESYRLAHDDLVLGRVDRDLTLSAIARLREEIAATEEAMARLGPTTSAAAPYDVRATLLAAPLYALRKALSAIMEVTVHRQVGGGPVARGDRRHPRPGSITVRWLDEPIFPPGRASEATPDWSHLHLPRDWKPGNGHPNIVAPTWFWHYRADFLAPVQPLSEACRSTLWHALAPHAVGIDITHQRSAAAKAIAKSTHGMNPSSAPASKPAGLPDLTAAWASSHGLPVEPALAPERRADQDDRTVPDENP